MAKGAKRTTAHPHSETDPLADYRKKRDFSVTPEPTPSSQDGAKKEKKAEGAPLEFVVQKHDATRMHYDLRLEIAGAMASWAVPTGPSYDPAVKRLAVATEDHPMEYNRFEGRIPDGEYGAGDVLIWDRGTYETVPPDQQEAMRAKGHIAFRLRGDKLTGEWHLVKTHGKGDDHDKPSNAWLLFKAKDSAADPSRDVVAERPESVVSGLSATRGPRRVGASQQGKTARALLEAVGEPMKARLATSLVDPDSYLYEIKYDGYRLVAARAGGEVRLVTRNGNDWTSRFRPIAGAIGRLDVRECVLDGEACVVDAAGRPSFGDLQAWIAGEKTSGQLGFAAFDLLWLDGRDLRGLPIEERKQLLSALLKDAEAPLSVSTAAAGPFEQIASVARASGLEGLVAKKKGSPYVPGSSSTAWLKIKFDKRQDCVIVGYIPLAGTTDEMGALLLAVMEGDGKLHFAGRVGTGFSDRERREMARLLDADFVSAPPVEAAPRIKGARWCAPRRVCEIRFANWTRDGSARAPSFLGLREDKSPAECVREDEAPVAVPPPSIVPKTVARPKTAVTLSNPDKVLYPRDGITKRRIFDYYTAIAPTMLRHLEGRPLTLQRWPDGIDGEEWYQQNAPEKVPGYVRLVDVGPKHGNKKRIVADSLETLQWLANLASLTLHQWASHVPAGVADPSESLSALAQPDYSVIDLDPGDGTWAHLIEVAQAVRALLEALEMPSAVKTSGKRGIHVVVPVARGYTHDEATAFAEKIARAVAKVLPEIATVERTKAKREGKLYVDFLQNGEGRTVVAPYTLRALDGAPVSTPIAWDEVTESLDPRAFSMSVVLGRVAARGDLFAAALANGKKIPPLA
jgi:bifunctional non-homologous end joining protein LigD